MRGRAIGLGLLGRGAFLLAAALAVRLFLEPALVKLPLDQTAEPTAQGTGVDFFDLSTQRQLRGLEADVRQRVEGDAGSEAAGDDVAVWNFGSTVTSTDGVLLNAGRIACASTAAPPWPWTARSTTSTTTTTSPSRASP